MPLLLEAQIDSTSKFVLRNLKIEGYKRTKEFIILRELDFAIGDTLAYADTAQVFERNRDKVFNTGLFTHVDIKMGAVDGELGEISVIVNERWYIWPAVIFELADRNFNEWWHDRDRDFSRTDYGVRFKHDNFRGRNEKLKLILQSGFTKKYELIYDIPYVNKKRTTGVTFYGHYSTNRSVAYRTDDHKLLFYNNEDNLVRTRYWFGGELKKRPLFYRFHALNFRYQYSEVLDSVALLNPDFFLNGRNHVRFLKGEYHFSNDHRNIRYYPTKGNYFKLFIEQIGFRVFSPYAQTNIHATYAHYWELTKKVFYASIVRSKISAPSRQAYFNVRGIGWGQTVVRGFELNVVDGQHYWLNQNSIKWRFLNIEKFENKLIPFKQFRTIPFAMVLKLHADWAYVVDDSVNPLNTRLANRMLFGVGAGLDMITYYDVVWRLEYSLNSMGEHGFFIHFLAEL